MRFFGLFNFDREGPGVPKNPVKKSRFVVFFEILARKFFKLIQISLIYAAFCVPIITIGPATAAFTYVIRNFAREEHSFVWWDFYEAFKKNFKQSLVVGIVDLLVTFLFAADIYIYILLAASGEMPAFFNLISGLALVGFLLYYIMRFYLYTIIVTFTIKLRHAYKNAFIFTLAKLPQNLLTAIIVIAVNLLLFGIPAYFNLQLVIFSAALYVLFFAGFTWLIAVFRTYPYIKKHWINVVSPEEDEDGEEDDEVFKDAEK